MNTIQRYKDYTKRLKEFSEWSKKERAKRNFKTPQEKYLEDLRRAFERLRTVFSAFSSQEDFKKLLLWLEAENKKKKTLKYKFQVLANAFKKVKEAVSEHIIFHLKAWRIL